MTRNNLLFKKKVRSTRFARKRLLREIEKKIIKKWVDKTELNEYEFYLILDEAITNAMEHGNRWDKHKYIEVEIITNGSSIIITVEDEGLGFDYEKVYRKDIRKEGTLSPRGRGIYIIKKLAKVKWNDIGNQITITIDLKGEPAKNDRKKAERSIL